MSVKNFAGGSVREVRGGILIFDGARGDPIKLKVFIFLILIIAAGVAYYHFVYVPGHRLPLEAAYVLPLSIEVVDTPAALRLNVEELRNGDRVDVLSRTRNWTQVRLADGKTGWLESKALLDSETYERGQQILEQVGKLEAQAAGHTTSEINLHLEPSRQSPALTLLKINEPVKLFERRVEERKSGATDATTPAEDIAEAAPGVGVRDAWYLVRAGSRAGWVLGRFVELEVPPAISAYAQDVNMVAWLVLNTVPDNGENVPQYVVADRIGTQEFDFNHIRVFTWWAKKQHYATAFVESDLNGFFPIRTSQVDGTPQFRLRLVDAKGRRFQKVYGLLDTVVHPLGTVEGWESDAQPAPAVKKRRRR